MSYIGFKHFMDKFSAIVGVLLLSPILVLICFLIKIDSRGPVFFLQKRVGKNRKDFVIWKFRTMKTGSNTIKRDDGTIITTANDPRVTRLGRFLRKGIDELPQLWNVIKGDMSIVGPRPDLPEQLKSFSEIEIRKYSVRPGITNLPAICGRNDLDFKDRIAIDLYYIENQSFKLDLIIIFYTLMMPFGVKYKLMNKANYFDA